MDTASILINSLGWAIANSLWQGALVFCLMRLLLLAMPNNSSKTKYLLSYASLSVLFAWFLSTVLMEWQRLQAVTVQVTEVGKDTAGYKVFFIKTIPQQTAGFADSILSHAERFFPWISVIYLAGVAFLALRLLVSLVQVHLLRTRGIQQPSADMTELFNGLCYHLGLQRKVKLLLTDKLNVPVVFGALKPIILLPLTSITQLDQKQLEAILVHELAHIKRHDYLLNIFQSIAETFLFFNPFTWLIASVIRREREHCCDDIVLAHTSQPLPYATALATLEAYRLNHGSLVMAATGSHNNFLHRIKRIVEMKKQQTNYSNVLAVLLLTVGLSVSVAWLTPAFAQNKKEQTKTQPATTSKSKIAVVDEQGKRTDYDSPEELPATIREAVGEAMKASGTAMVTATEAMKLAENVMKEIDFSSIMKDATVEVTKAMSEVDWNQINAEVNAEVTKAFAEIDWEEINAEISTALRETDSVLKDPKLKEEMRAKMREAQGKARAAAAEARAQGAEARARAREAQGRAEDARTRAAEAHGHADEARARAEASRQRADEARTRADEARQRSAEAMARSASPYSSNTTNYNRLLDRMEADGMISRSKGFTIKKTGDKLIVNGKRQDDNVLQKYSRYLPHDRVTVKGKGTNLSINVRD